MAKKTQQPRAKPPPAPPPHEATLSSIDDIFAQPQPKTKLNHSSGLSAAAAASSSLSSASFSSSKTKHGIVSPTAGPSSHPDPAKTKKKNKAVTAFVPDAPATSTFAPKSAPISVERRPETAQTPLERRVETILDPSATAAHGPALPLDGQTAVKSKSKSIERLGVGAKKRRKGKDEEEDALFADSRGEGPRRRTEEGYIIYKEADLGIDPEAGGTPLCPFDCDCCF